MSTPNWAIGFIKTCARGSIIDVTTISALWAWEIKNVGSNKSPFLPGSWIKRPKTSSWLLKYFWLKRFNLIPNGLALVNKTLNVWSKTFSSTKKVFEDLFFLEEKLIVIASAAAVPSSKRDALAMEKPVNSQIKVWKLNKASNLPWAISAW